MSTASPLAPAPTGMRAHIQHDGVHWSFTSAMGALIPAASFAAAIAVPLVLFAAASWVGLAYLVPVGLIAMAAARTPMRYDVRINERRLVVEVPRISGTERRVIRVDEIDLVRIAEPPEQGGTGQLVVRARHDVIAVGRDQPRSHLAWFTTVIETARATSERRARVEGREYSFLRVTPEPVSALRDASRPTTER